MTAKKSDKTYRVLVGIANDTTGKRFKPGDTVTPADFSAAHIAEWLKTSPPVLIDNDVYVASLPLENTK